jgi:hypothetical protein
MLFLAHWMDYPPAGRGAYRRCQSRAAVSSSIVFVPRDQPHGFTVTGAGPARALVITGPSRLAAQIAARGEPGPPGLGL